MYLSLKPAVFNNKVLILKVTGHRIVLVKSVQFFSLVEVLHYMGYIARYRYVWPPKGIVSQPYLLINRVLILVILLIKKAWFLHSNLELGTFSRRRFFFVIINKADQQKSFAMPLT